MGTAQDRRTPGRRVRGKLAALGNRLLDPVRGWRCRREGPLLILFCEGGVSAQITQYIYGQMLLDKGYRLKYDHTFYRENGADADGRFDRSFTLDRLCELDRFSVAPAWQSGYYRRHHLYAGNQPPNDPVADLDRPWQPPLFLGQYYRCEPQQFLPAVRRYIRLRPPEQVLDGPGLALYREISACDAVGVHVRRGDMANQAYHRRLPELEYYLNAVTAPEFAGKTFYFFSDEPDWVRDTLLPRLPSGTDCRLVQGNDSYYGYRDLLLLSACRHQIASGGSFGKMAFIFNRYPGKTLMYFTLEGTKDDRFAGENVIYWTADGKRLP